MTLPLRRLALALLAAAAPAHGPSRAEEPPVVRVYNWSEYVGDDTLAGFEKATGIKVEYSTFESNEELHAKLLAGGGGYDVVVPSSNWGKQQLSSGLLLPLDKARLPNLANLDPLVEEQLARLDPGNAYLVPWLWGFTTLGINVARVKGALGALPMPENAWDLLFKPEYVSRLKRCGVSVVDSATEVVPVALHYLGRPPYSSELADYAGVSALLASIRPYVTKFSAATYIDELAAGRLCLVLGYNGDINIARRRALAKRNGQDIQALVPRSGGILFFDTMAIPKDAPHPGNAHRFIDYILRPEVHAGLTNKVFYANPNRASLRLVRPEVASDATVFPPPEDLRRMEPPPALTEDTRRMMMRIYSRWKQGK